MEQCQNGVLLNVKNLQNGAYIVTIGNTSKLFTVVK